jgi:hypothetical protein
MQDLFQLVFISLLAHNHLCTSMFRVKTEAFILFEEKQTFQLHV